MELVEEGWNNRVVVIPPALIAEKEATAKNEDTSDDSGVLRQVGKEDFKWWLPFTCKEKSFVVIDGKRIGAKCGSRGCLDCYQSKMRKWIQVAHEVKKTKEERLYSLVATPQKKVKTREDVDSFLSGVRKMMRKWERSSASLGAAWWVAECVVNWDEEPTQMICPCQGGCVPPEWEEGFEPDQWTTATSKAVSKVFTDCNSVPFRYRGKKELPPEKYQGCPYCRGRGVLPSVHLHAHIAVICKPFYFGKGEQKEGLDFPQTFNGRGYQGLAAECGLGFVSVETLKSRKGICGYLTKAVLKYITKATGKEVDWETSIKENLVSHAIYGKKRARGVNGRAYGMKVSRKDAAMEVRYGGLLVDSLERLDEPQKGCTVSALSGEYQRPEKVEMKSGKPVTIMEVGKKAILNRENLGKVGIDEYNDTRVSLAAERLNVLNETQLDTPHKTTIHYSDGTYRTASTLQGQIGLSRRWEGVPVVRGDSIWSKARMIPNTDAMEAYLGRGSSVIYIPPSSVEWLDDIRELLPIIADYPREHWQTAIDNHIYGKKQAAIIEMEKRLCSA